MHNIDVIGVKRDIALMAFIKALYPTYSHYLESVQASGQLKSLYFDSLVEKIVEHEKDFGKKTTQPTWETVCLAQKGKNQSCDSSRWGCSRRRYVNSFVEKWKNQSCDEDVVGEDIEIIISEARVGQIMVKDMIFTVSIVVRMDMMKM